MADDEVTVVAHAARQEVRFCLDNVASRPGRLWDVQIAEGLRTRSYPLNHERLVHRVLGKKVPGTQSRTDWRRRPLSDRQVDYARDDVRFLLAIHQRQHQSLSALGRETWAEAEFERMIDEVEAERGEEACGECMEGGCSGSIDLVGEVEMGRVAGAAPGAVGKD